MGQCVERYRVGTEETDIKHGFRVGKGKAGKISIKACAR